MKRRYWLLSIIAFLLSLGLPLVMGGMNLLPAFSHLSITWLSMMLLLIFIGWNLNAGRLRLLTGGIGIHINQTSALATVMATEFAICATPGGTGGPPTCAWLLKPLGVPVPHSLAFYAVDQAFDVLFFLIALVAVTLYWILIPAQLDLSWQLSILGSMLATGIGLGCVLMRYHKSIARYLEHLFQRLRLSTASRQRLTQWVVEFRLCLRLVGNYSFARLLSIFALATGHWLLRYSMLYLAIRGVGGGISWSYAFLSQMLSHTAGQATFLPGGSGGAEAGGLILLMPYMDTASAAASVLLWRFTTFYWYLIAGGTVFSIFAGRSLWRRLAETNTVTPLTASEEP